ncbi:N-acylphosphatidylethanolamine synthase [Smittium culicis]|uniref:Tafazzin family protein n=1 Tax=Smittium culicis TaxID=133412 RepID=A0A1R1YFX3_9FUNG|nr:N-acylphosphatidylethanolamine synthase [Smittium culicis]
MEPSETKIRQVDYSKLTLKAHSYFRAKSLAQNSFWWHPLSKAVIHSTSFAASLLLKLSFNRISIKGSDKFVSLLTDKNRQNSIITYSNHISTFDDPIIWGTLPKHIYARPELMRWTLGAKELTFINP